MRYRLQTLFIPTDMNNWKASGSRKVISIESETEFVSFISYSASLIDLAWGGTSAIIV
jgi:hypothetical protein